LCFIRYRPIHRVSLNKGFTKLSEAVKYYSFFRSLEKLSKALYRIKRFVRDYAAALRSLECDILISRSHCNVARYLTYQKSGEVAC
jgi:hypothetical protein